MKTQTVEQRMENATLRAAAYGLFAKAFRRPRQFDEPWVRDSLVKGLSDLASRFKAEGMTAADIPPFQIRQLEFNRLFESHGQMVAPPYETEYIKDWPQQSLIQATILADIQGFYQAFGLEIGSHFAERCDHIRLELEFLHFLGLKEAIAMDRDEAEHLKVVQGAQKKFLEDHASRWPEKFAKRLRETTALPFYQKIATLLEKWIAEDMKTIGCTPYRPCQPLTGE